MNFSFSGCAKTLVGYWHNGEDTCDTDNKLLPACYLSSEQEFVIM